MGVTITTTGTTVTRIWDARATRELAEAVLAEIDERTFTEGVGADGQPFGLHKSGPKKGQPITLVRTGALEASIKVTRATETRATISATGEAVKRARILGARFPFLGLAPQDADAATVALGEAMAGAAKRSAGRVGQ